MKQLAEAIILGLRLTMNVIVAVLFTLFVITPMIYIVRIWMGYWGIL